MLGAGKLAGGQPTVRPEFLECVGSFGRNWRRVVALADLPLMLTHEVMVYEAARYRVYENRFGTVSPTRAQFIQHGDKDGTWVDDAIVKEYRQPRLVAGGGFIKMVPVDEAVSAVENLPAGSPAIYAILAAVIANAWTAFESLVEDLWISAVNDRPDPLVKNFLARLLPFALVTPRG